MQSIKIILVTAATIFVGFLGIIVLFTNAELTDKLLGSLAFASLGAATLLFGPSFLGWWAHDVKQEHEAKVNDGSFRYRLSQGKYVIALVVYGLVWLLFAYAIFHHRGRGGG